MEHSWVNVQVRCEDLEDAFPPRGRAASGSSSANISIHHRHAHSLAQLNGGAEHWRTTKAFRRVEEQRRLLNQGGCSHRLFMSHSWRDPKTQATKRRIVAHLSTPQQQGGPGLSYWADWLDLQAGSNGGLPWSAEVEESIASCSKFVALVDAAWLTTYSCLQARHHSPTLFIPSHPITRTRRHKHAPDKLASFHIHVLTHTVIRTPCIRSGPAYTCPRSDGTTEKRRSIANVSVGCMRAQCN